MGLRFVEQSLYFGAVAGVFVLAEAHEVPQGRGVDEVQSWFGCGRRRLVAAAAGSGCGCGLGELEDLVLYVE